MMENEVLQVGFAVILACPVVPVILGGGEAAQPFLDVFYEPELEVVHVYGRGYVHRTDKAKPLLDAGSPDHL